MKKVFVKTQNVKNFISMMNNIQNRPEGVPGMALVFGEPGLGKTQEVLLELKEEGVINSYSDNMYEFTDKKRVKISKAKITVHPTRRKFYYDQIYYYARDYYLLYAVPTIRDAVEMAKERFVKETPLINIEDLGDGGNLYHRLYKEFDDKTIELYRKSSDELRENFKEKNKHKFRIVRPYEKHIENTIDNIPEYFNFGMNGFLEYFNFGMNEFLENLRLVITQNKNELLRYQEIQVNKSHSIRLKKDYLGNTKLSHGVFDTLIALIHLYRYKEKGENNAVVINIDDILFLKNYKEDKQKNLQGTHYRPDNRIQAFEQMELLSNILVYTNHKVKPEDLISFEEFKPSKISVFYYKLKINKDILKILRGKIKSNILSFNHEAIHAIERRLAYHLCYLFDERKTKKLEMSFEEMFNIIEKERPYTIDKRKHITITRSLDNLVQQGIISGWEFVFNNPNADKDNLYMNFYDIKIIFTQD